jgi:lysine N6-hydroxylase
MIYDIIGIGIGPFNLGLAALLADLPELTSIFFDGEPTFRWHPGLLLPNARLQVPYYADLVTLASPQNRFSYLSFLHTKQRLFRFAIQENPYPLRREYQEYAQWVAAQLPCLHFGYTCINVYWCEQEQCYAVHCTDRSGGLHTFHGKQLVLGTGTRPYLPSCVQGIQHPLVFHASEYLFNKKNLAGQAKITLVGSGQSAAEVFQDLLTHGHPKSELAWFTRSPRFFPMEVAKLTLEMTSPDYIDYFYGLPTTEKKKLLRQQDPLYKGINAALIGEIYDSLYSQSLEQGKMPHRLATNCELVKIRVRSDELQLDFQETVQQKEFSHRTQALILATGYRYTVPDFLQPIQHRIHWTPEGGYEVRRDYSISKTGDIFVQNAELTSHGFNTPDLGMGPYRNAVILNRVLGYDHFILEKAIAFQTFGAPGAS